VDGRAQRDQLIINAAAFLRSLGVGLMGVVLGIYLSRIGLSAFRIGAVLAVGLAGSAVATTVVGFAEDHYGECAKAIVFQLITFRMIERFRLSA
jgi:MFS family permease